MKIKKRQIQGPCQRIKVEHKSDGDDNRSWSTQISLKSLRKGSVRPGNQIKNQGYLDNSIFEIGQNSEKSPSDLKRLAVTLRPLKDPPTNSEWKTRNNNNNNNEFWQKDQRTKKLMKMHKALHARDDRDRLYVWRKDGRRGLASIDENVGASIWRLKNYIKKCKVSLITSTRNNTDNIKINRTTIIRK